MNPPIEITVLGKVVAYAFYVLGGLLCAVKLWQALRPRPAASEIHEAACRSTAQVSERVTAVERNHESLSGRVVVVEGRTHELEQCQRTSAKDAHQRMDRIESSLGRITGKVEEGFEHVTRNLGEVRTELNGIRREGLR